ncbi:MAG TPA: M20/M25/M40 family metallo-hydrolase, partial [Candidatus Acidoferrales bacterium]|nr:M20/M25/M40 family metallo-hydrolase [Candidatus Acidoferrales bacterium]
ALAHVSYLADPARGGRLSGSPQFADAAAYVSERFRELGLEPLGDGGTFLEHFTQPIVGLGAPARLEMLAPSSRSFRWRTDFTEYVSGRAGGGTAEGAISVAGHGEPSDVADLDLTGRIALVTTSPRGNPIETAYQRHAVAVLVVVDQPGIRFSPLPFLETATIPVLHIARSVADELVPGGIEARHGDVPTRVRVSVPLEAVRQVQSANAVALLRGTDPAAAQRAVMVGGHLDGLGTDPDGVVYPGGNDNASGVAIMLEAARTLVAKRAQLRHSIVFVAFGGEEEGYLGASAYILQTATTPGRVESLVAFLDVDASGCCGDALGASANDHDLQARVLDAVRARGLPTTVPTGGSDHDVFSRAHVPAVLVQWNDVELHTPDDAAARVDARHLKGVGDVIVTVALDLAGHHP